MTDPFARKTYTATEVLESSIAGARRDIERADGDLVGLEQQIAMVQETRTADLATLDNLQAALKRLNPQCMCCPAPQVDDRKITDL